MLSQATLTVRSDSFEPIPSAPALEAGSRSCSTKAVPARECNDQWCWAASAQIALRAFQLQETQQQVATSHIEHLAQHQQPGVSACGDCADCRPECDQRCPMSTVAEIYRSRGLACSDPGPPVGAQELLDELCAGRPVLIGYTYTASQARHQAVLIGAFEAEGKQFFEIADPEMGGVKLVIDRGPLLARPNERRVWSSTWLFS